MARTYLELVEGTSSKFWEITVEGTEHTVRYGKIGTDGRTTTKSFASDEEAQAEAEKLIKSKRKKGYEAPESSADSSADSSAKSISIDELREAYPALEQVDWLVDLAETATLYKGNVETNADGLLSLAVEQAEAGTIIVVDGDLTCTSEDLTWGERGDYSNNALLVTGNLTVNNLHLSYIGALIVGGSLKGNNIIACYGDDGGSLDVAGDLTAKTFIASTYFVIEVGGKVNIERIFADGTYASDFVEEENYFPLYDEENIYAEELSEDGEIDERELYAWITSGKPYFVNDGKPREGSYEKSWEDGSEAGEEPPEQPSSAPAKTYLELVDDGSSKFWEITVEGTEHTVRYGKIGADGRTTTKSFDSEEDARAEAEKLIKSKRKKGYGEPSVEGEVLSIDELLENYPRLREFGDGLIDMATVGVLFRGDVLNAGSGLLDIAPEQGDEGTVIVIDGNLTCTAQNIGWGNREEFSNDVFLVTGDMTANNIELSEIGVVEVGGSLTAKNIFVSYGDDGGSMGILGDLKAEVVIATTYFVFDVVGKVDVKHIIGGTYATDFATQRGLEVIETYDEANIFVDELVDDGEVDEQELYERLVSGKPIFVNGGKPREGSYEKEW